MEWLIDWGGLVLSCLVRYVARPMLFVGLEWGHTTSKICAEPNNIEIKPSGGYAFLSVTPFILEDD